MSVLLLFVVLVAIFPWLLLPLMLVLLINLLLIPFGFAIRSLHDLFTVPGMLFKIAVNPDLRKNHALEHATINVIEEQYGPLRLTGQAVTDGFFIYGPVDPAVIDAAARMAHGRLLAGERALVVHKRCGTTIAAANLVSSVVFLLLLFLTGHFTWVAVLVALAIANAIGPLLGTVLQRLLTTSWDVRDRRIAGVSPHDGRIPGVFPGGGAGRNAVFVRTEVVTQKGDC